MTGATPHRRDPCMRPQISKAKASPQEDRVEKALAIVGVLNLSSMRGLSWVRRRPDTISKIVYIWVQTLSQILKGSVTLKIL